MGSVLSHVATEGESAISTASKFTDDLRAKNVQLAAETKEVMTALSSLANAKLDKFFLETVNGAEAEAQRLVPIDRVLRKLRYTYVHASTRGTGSNEDGSNKGDAGAKKNPEELLADEEKVYPGNATKEDPGKSEKEDPGKAKKDPDDVDHVVSSVSSCEVFQKFLKGVLTSAVDILLGNVQGSESEHSSFTIGANELGGVFRVDYYLYTYQITAQDVVKEIKSIYALGLVISSVDANILDLNTVRTIVGMSHSGDKLPAGTDLIKLISEMLPQKPAVQN